MTKKRPVYLHIMVQEPLNRAIENVLNQGFFQTKSDFVRSSIRRTLEQFGEISYDPQILNNYQFQPQNSAKVKTLDSH